MRIDSSGNVGIGTTSPSGASGKVLEINGGSGQSRLVFKNDTTGSASTDGQQIFSDGTTLGIQNREAGNITFETNGGERMRIDSSGQLAVGRTDPKEWHSTYKSIQLVDAGTFYANTNDSFVAYGANHYLNTSGNFIYDKTDFASRLYQIDGGFYFETAASGTAGSTLTFTEVMKLDSAGNLTIGTDGASGSGPSTGYDELCIEGGNEHIGMCFLSPAANSVDQTIAFGDSNNNKSGRIRYQHSTDALTFDTAGSEQMRIDSSGKVGIGTSSPSTLLNIKGTDTAYSGGVAVGAIFQGEDSSGRKVQLVAPGSVGEAGVGTPTNHSFTLFTGNTERIRIDTSGKVGIGTTDIRSTLHIGSGIGGGNVPTHELMFGANNSDITFLSANDSTSVDGTIGSWNTVYNHQNSKIVFDKNAGNTGQLLFFTQGGSGITERMRIDSDGKVGIGKTASGCTLDVEPNNNTHAIRANGAQAGYATILCDNRDSSGTRHYISFRINNGVTGKITSTGSSTVYATSSDYRLKENVVSISDGITRLKTLKPSRFNWKVDSSTTVDGFLAHEVTAVPEAVVGTKDEVDSDNNPVYQAIDEGKLVPLLVAALQEAITKIETLETKVAALEAA